MLGIELQQTRVYQEAREEGRQAEGVAVVLKQLQRKLGELPNEIQAQIVEFYLKCYYISITTFQGRGYVHAKNSSSR